MISNLAGWLFDPSGLTPHGFCLLWEPWLIWTHALGNAAIDGATSTSARASHPVGPRDGHPTQ